VLFLVAPLSTGFYLFPQTNLALACLVLPCALANSLFCPSVTLLHNLAPAHLRPPLSAIFVLAINVVGMGSGPLLVGTLSQWVFADAGADALAYPASPLRRTRSWVHKSPEGSRDRRRNTADADAPLKYAIDTIGCITARIKSLIFGHFALLDLPENIGLHAFRKRLESIICNCYAPTFRDRFAYLAGRHA
jgi:hypothetical protein